MPRMTRAGWMRASTMLAKAEAIAPAKQKNWFGREWHPSDELIHWSQVKHRNHGKEETPEFKKFVDQLRADWDLLHSWPGLAAAHDRLLEAARDKASFEQGEIDAGEDL